MKQQTLVILPGWGGSHETWADFVGLLQQDITHVHVIDLPCFGNEPCPSSVWGIEDYAQFARKKIDALKKEDIVLLGHSFGGHVAAAIAAEHPKTITQLILVGAAIYRPSRVGKRLLFGAIAKIGKMIFRIPGLHFLAPLARKALYKAADSPDYANTDGRKRKIFKHVIREDGRHRLKNISIPTHVIWGEHDTYVPLSVGETLKESIPDATFHMIQNGNHGLHHDYQEEFKEQILSVMT